MKHEAVPMRALIAGVLVLAMSACTMKNQEAPPLAGPAEFGTSLQVTVSPDVLRQDGASQSIVTVTARDNNGAPLRNLLLRAEINVEGVTADFGSLSARTVVTGSDGRATLVYTAPPAPPNSPDTFTLVSIMVTPVGTDFSNAVTQLATIRLVPSGNTVPPDGLQPAFTFTPNAPLQGQNVFFDGRSSTSPSTNPIASYQWDFGDGSTATGQSATHAYATPATYFPRLTIFDSFGRSRSTTQTITVGQSAAPTADFVISPTNPRINQPINFNASASTPGPGRRIVSYSWDFGDGTQQSTSSPIISHAYGLVRAYTVTLVVTDDLGRTQTKSNVVSPTAAVAVQ